MHLLEFRKIIKVGLRFGVPDGTVPVLAATGEPAGDVHGAVAVRIVFWVPQKQPHQRRGVRVAVNDSPPLPGEFRHPLDGRTLVHDVMPFELDALTAGALVEHVFDFNYPHNPTNETLRRDLMPHWERLTMASLGYAPNSAPHALERSSVIFTAS